MLFPIIMVYFLFMKPVPKLQKIYSFPEKQNSSKLNIISVHESKNNFECYEVNISKIFLPFVFNYNKNLKKGTCASCGYNTFIQNTTISTPIGDITTSIFIK
jgi:hypothetical protein